ncbi:MAG TPA: hypothetical protein VFJ51_09185 [Nitrososphaeraceae archaeon]|nr:hypothetical protein [Nitrososphaeraceae archaeon]
MKKINNNDNSNAAVFFVIILLLMSSSLLLIVLYSGNNSIVMTPAQARTTKKAFPLESLQFAEQPPVGTEPIALDTSNNSAYALTIDHHLAITSVNASKTQARMHTSCLPELNRFILPRKQATFAVIKQCVIITGKVVWTNYFNEDGDANFNVVLDPPYKNMLGPGSYSIVFTNRYPGGPAIHAETVCQGPVTSTSRENLGACNGYNGPDFRPVLPKIGDHVMVTGRYLIEMPEMPGGITEIHPVYDIRILPPSSPPNS